MRDLCTLRTHAPSSGRAYVQAIITALHPSYQAVSTHRLQTHKAVQMYPYPLTSRARSWAVRCSRLKTSWLSVEAKKLAARFPPETTKMDVRVTVCGGSMAQQSRCMRQLL